MLTHVWGPAYAGETNYLRVYLAQLRRKLETDPANPRHLLTETGAGLPLPGVRPRTPGGCRRRALTGRRVGALRKH